MSSQGTRTRITQDVRDVGIIYPVSFPAWRDGPSSLGSQSVVTGKQITVSESHPRDRKDGSYRSGGPFYTSRVTKFVKPGFIRRAFNASTSQFYDGPVYGLPPSESEMKSLNYSNISEAFGDKNESQLLSDGTTAISLCNPINPASDLGTGLAETFREGVPSLPGIQLWRQRTEALKGLGSEYLNYVFGWAPLHKEVTDVVKAARTHRDIMKQYHRGEGSDTHREFHFPTERSVTTLPPTAGNSVQVNSSSWRGVPVQSRQVFRIKETKKWFEGCFTYGLPSSTDSWRKALGFGSDADQLFGLALTPDILWELTPWSWAVDWFSNAGEVINNVTNFGLAGLVLRYGYMMEESIDRVFASGSGYTFNVRTIWERTPKEGNKRIVDTPTNSGNWSNGVETVTKRRYPASPFGFSIGWEGLSPTQLAITAALGITRLL